MPSLTGITRYAEHKRVETVAPEATGVAFSAFVRLTAVIDDAPLMDDPNVARVSLIRKWQPTRVIVIDKVGYPVMNGRKVLLSGPFVKKNGEPSLVSAEQQWFSHGPALRESVPQWLQDLIYADDFATRELLAVLPAEALS